jgi:hypothetical protein
VGELVQEIIHKDLTLIYSIKWIIMMMDFIKVKVQPADKQAEKIDSISVKNLISVQNKSLSKANLIIIFWTSKMNNMKASHSQGLQLITTIR